MWRIIAHINWIFFLFGFLLIAGSFIDGMDKSFSNNYFEDKSESLKISEPLFSDEAKFLYDFPNIDDYEPLKVEKFPFHLFTHFIVKNMDDTGIHKSPWLADTLTCHSILKNQTYLAPFLEEKTLLVSIKSKNYSENLIKKAYEQLKILQTAFPESNYGVVFEFDEIKNVSRDSIVKLDDEITKNIT